MFLVLSLPRSLLFIAAVRFVYPLVNLSRLWFLSVSCFPLSLSSRSFLSLPVPLSLLSFPSSLGLFLLVSPFFLYADSDDFTAYCLILPLLGIGPEWWMDSHNIHHVVCNDVHCGEEIVWASWGGGLLRAANSISPPTPTINTNITTTNATKNIPGMSQ